MMMTIALNKAALTHLPSTIPGPGYDRSIPARVVGALLLRLPGRGAGAAIRLTMAGDFTALTLTLMIGI